MENAEKLARAVQEIDVEASLKLLQDAGGACQARDLAKAAKTLTRKENDGNGIVGFSLNVHGNKETVELHLHYPHATIPVVALEQDICKR